MSGEHGGNDLDPSDDVSQTEAPSFGKHFRHISILVFGLQGIVLLAISIFLSSRFDLTRDFATFEQSWFLIAHGHINPFSTIFFEPFWVDHLEWIMWPLAATYFVYPHPLTLLLVQDIGIIGSELFAFSLIKYSIQKGNGYLGRNASRLRWLGLILLVANPWVYYSVVFDFHFHSLAALWVLGTTWAFTFDKRIMGVCFALLCVATGNVYILFLVPVGIVLVLWHRRRAGVLICLVSVIVFLLEETMFYHGLGGLGFPVALAASAKHGLIHQSGALKVLSNIWSIGFRIPRAMWAGRMNFYANLGPDGFISLLSPAGLLVPGMALAESSLGGVLFSQPGTQNFIAYGFLAVGTVGFLVWLARRVSHVIPPLIVLLLANELFWSASGISAIRYRTAVPSSEAAKALTALSNSIPATSEVVASQSIIGGFAEREYVYLFTPTIPIRTQQLYFVVTAYNGIGRDNTSNILARISFLASLRGVKLVMNRAGIWAFEWMAPRDTRMISLSYSNKVLLGWTGNSQVGRADLNGPVSSWSMLAHIGSGPGYVLDKLYWRLRPGVHVASVRLSSSGQVEAEVWNATGGVLLARRFIPGSALKVNVSLPFNNTLQFPTRLYSGWGPFRYSPVPRYPNFDQIEVRIWTDGASNVKVYSVGMH